MTKIHYKNRAYPVSKWLSTKQVASLGLTLWQRLSLWLWHTALLTRCKPKGWRGAANFYIVKDKKGYYISYPQGFDEVLYVPD